MSDNAGGNADRDAFFTALGRVFQEYHDVSRDTRQLITLGLPRWSALTPKVEVKSRLGPEEPRSILLPGNGTASTLWRHRFHRVRLVLASQRIGRPLPPG